MAFVPPETDEIITPAWTPPETDEIILTPVDIEEQDARFAQGFESMRSLSTKMRAGEDSPLARQRIENISNRAMEQPLPVSSTIGQIATSVSPNNLVKGFGRVAQGTGKVGVGLLADLGNIGTGQDEPIFGNTKSALAGEPMQAERDVNSLPIIPRVIGRAAQGLIEMTPKMAATAALSPAVSPPVAAGAVFGSTPEGFDVKQAVIAASLPMIGKYTGAATEALASKLGVQNDVALGILNKAGGVTGAAGVLTADQLYEISKLPPEQRKDAYVEMVASVVGQMALGGMNERGKFADINKSVNKSLSELNTKENAELLPEASKAMGEPSVGKESLFQAEGQIDLSNPLETTAKAIENPEEFSRLAQRAALESPKIVGMGGAIPEEFALRPQTLSSLRNTTVDFERQQRNLPPIMGEAARGFGEVWQKAMDKMDKQPEYQEGLIKDLEKKPRALTDLEDAVVLHLQIDLQNEYSKAARDLAQAYDDGRMEDVAEQRIRSANLSDELLKIYEIGRKSGTETGRGLNARKIMAYEDFSLGKMMVDKRAANEGRPLTPKEESELLASHEKITKTQQALDDYESKRLAAWKKRTTLRTQQLEGKIAAGDFTKTPRPEPVKLDAEGLRLKAENERAKAEFRTGLIRDQLRQRTISEKVQDTFIKWRRAFILSSPITLAKLTSAAIQRMTFTPVEEAIGSVISRVIPSVANKAAREGGASVKAEAKALTEGFTKGMSDAWKTLKTGHSDLDMVYGKQYNMPRSMLDFVGQLHGALKAVTKRNEFARSFQKRAEFYIKKGVDVTDPLVQTQMAVEAYKDANRSIFMQDNRVVNAYKRMLSAFEQKDKAGILPASGKALSTTARFLLPIVKIPTNIVAETLQYATGSVTGSIKLARAFAKGVEGLNPDQSELIMRELKKGSLGAAIMLLGYLSADGIGGYYQSGEKRNPKDVKAGNLVLFGEEVPSYLLHNPLLENLQIGSTISRVEDSKLRKKDLERRGFSQGVLAAATGIIEETPFIKEMEEISKAFNANERNAFFGELVKASVTPQLFQWLARQMDTDVRGETIQRAPETIVEYIKTGIPGMRESVAQKKK